LAFARVEAKMGVRRLLGTAGLTATILSAAAGDIVTALAGQPVTSLAALQSVLAAHKPGDRVQARVSRGGTGATAAVPSAASPASMRRWS
jgi:S1-C subfamily serine protease